MNFDKNGFNELSSLGMEPPGAMGQLASGASSTHNAGIHIWEFAMQVVQLFFPAAAYLLGSLNASLVLCQVMGLSDIRAQGSGNAGATNMQRAHGIGMAGVAFMLDFLKGMLILLAAQYLQFNHAMQASIAMMVLAGHCFPLFFGFKGGKGVATSLGLLMAISYKLALFGMFCWGMMLLATSVVAIASVTATLMTWVTSWWWTPDWFGVIGGLAALIVLQHRSNINAIFGPKHTE